ncbi:MAG: aspartate carbamoyltransferase catalytic subunit [Acidimicrobiia bacterium]
MTDLLADPPKDFLTVEGLSRPLLAELLQLAATMAEVGERPIPKVPALRGRTVVSVFFEDSTRTRMSFETAARRLSADVVNFAVGSSSVNKGESLRDTIETIEAMGVDALVVRHKSSGAPQQIAGWAQASVINGGDGWHQHPTQALLDAFTIAEARGTLHDEAPLAGQRIAIVGDIAHSRVARSDVEVFAELGADVVLVAPKTLLPWSLEGWRCSVSHRLDDVLGDIDVCYLLRMQLERQQASLVPSLREYTDLYGLTIERAKHLRSDALIMHPGPMNRGVEIDADVADLPRSLITRQVTNGVAVRMAVLFWLLGSKPRRGERLSSREEVR